MNFLSDLSVTSRLSFDPQEFTPEEFSVDEFIQRKRHSVPLDVLHDDLGSHLKLLRFSLIELINQDYGQFVNLSSNLVGLDGRIHNIAIPLKRAQAELEVLHDTLDSTLKNLEYELGEKRATRLAKSQLHFLRLASTAVSSSENYLRKVPFHFERIEDFKPLKICATEVAAAKYLLHNCCACPLLQELESRLERCCSELLDKLDALLQVFSSREKSGEPRDLIYDDDIVTSILFIYTEIECESKAEEVFVQKILKPVCEQVLSRKGNVSALLDETDEFIRSSTIIRVSQQLDAFPWMTKYEFISRGVFPLVVGILTRQFPHIWSPASPDSFHSNWTRCEAFVSSLEAHLPCTAHLQTFRSSETLKGFVEKWQFQVYFQLRFHSLAIELESALDLLMSPCVTSDFKLDASRVLVKVLGQCWEKEKIFMWQLFGRFMKASALLVSRFLNEITTKIALNPETSLADLIAVFCDLGLCELVVQQILKSKFEEVSNSSHIEQRNRLIDTGSLALAENYFQDSDKFLSAFQWESTKESIERRITELTVIQSTTNISAVNEVPRLFRRTNRDNPTKQSDYVENLLEPIFSLRNDIRTVKQGDLWEKLSLKIGNQVISRYVAQVQDVLTSVQKMEESIKRLKKVKAQSQSQKQNTMPNSTDGKVASTDDDKIRKQIQIDVNYFATRIKEVSPLIDISSIQTLFTNNNGL